jgi:hypothetical protein
LYELLGNQQGNLTTAEILLKVALSTIDQIKNQIRTIPFLLSLTCANVFNISPV